MTYTVTYHHYDTNTYSNTFATKQEAINFEKKVNQARCTVTNTNF